jgi:4-alpha-glucanotransferase
MNDAEEYQKWLTRLVSLKGIETHYQDVWGHIHSVNQETTLKILSAMGCPVEPLEDLKKAVLAEEHRSWRQLTEPALIISIGCLSEELFFQFPTENQGIEPVGLPEDLQVQLIIHEENGNITIQYFSHEKLLFKGAARIEDVLYLRGSLPFPKGLPLGYHHIIVSVRQADRHFSQDVKVILCPEKTYLPPTLSGNGKRVGLMISLAGLRSRNNWGVGDFGDLKELVRWAIEGLHVEVVGLLPLHYLSNREPYNISPYYPSSRLYRNPIYLSVPEIEEYEYSPEAKAIMAGSETLNLLNETRNSEKVQFEKVDRLKRKVLKKVFQTFLERHWKAAGQETQRQKEFQAYIEREGQWLDHFSVFCALADYFEKENQALYTWGQWPTPFQAPHSQEVITFKEEHWQEVLFHKYLQWQVEVQLSAVQKLAMKLGSGIGLYHDLALGIDPWGADSWAWRDYTITGVKVGAPPDDFSPKGQDWGFFPPDREKYRQEGYQLFAMEIRKNSRPGGALRIDHILKFSRLFWILEGRPAHEGVYVKYFLEDYLKILALESVRNKTLIIGEDLGTLPDHLREILYKQGVFSYRLFYFEKDETGHLIHPEAYPELALASVSTHDLPPLAGFWAMGDIVLRKNLGLFAEDGQFYQALSERIKDKRRMIDRLHQLGFLSKEDALTLHAQDEPVVTEGLHRAVLSYVLATKAKLTVISQEDLFLRKEQLNFPGTITTYPNWSRKMQYTIEELWNDPEVRKAADRFRELIDQSGRGVKKAVLSSE